MVLILELKFLVNRNIKAMRQKELNRYLNNHKQLRNEKDNTPDPL